MQPTRCALTAPFRPLLPALLFLPWAALAPAQEVDTSAAEKTRGYTYLNELRGRADMLPFAIDAALEEAAQNHSDYMAGNGRGGHEEIEGEPGFTGASPADRVVFAGYHAQPGENVSTGQDSVDSSIDGLMSAIYHRFGFLSFDHDEIGLGIAAAGPVGYYTYNSGNAGVNELCSAQQSASSGFFQVCASRPDLVIASDSLFQAQALVQGNNPNIVAWPAQGETDFPPGFYEEFPDPLPDYQVSGNPVSIQFNPLAFESVTLHSFRLFNHETGVEITDTRLLDTASDPNGRFSGLEFALFPLQRLDWNTAYRAQAVYSTDGGARQTLAWAFRTRDPGFPLFTLEQDGQVISVPHNYPEPRIYVPPAAESSSIRGYSLSSEFGTSAEADFLDGNTLALRLEGEVGHQFTFVLEDSRQFTLRIGMAASLQEKADVSLDLTVPEDGDNARREIAAARFIDADHRTAASSASFSLGLSLDGGLSFTDSARVSDSVNIIGIIEPEPEHVGQRVDIFVVDRVNLVFRMKTQDGVFADWNGRVPDLVPFLEDVTLEAGMEVDVFSGTLGEGGDHHLFLGYLPADGGLRYTPLPLRLTVTDGD